MQVKVRSQACLWAVIAWAGLTAPALALHTESPEVRAAVEKGLKFLDLGFASSDIDQHRLGAKSLVGLVLTKEGKVNHPRVLEAVKFIQDQVKVEYEVRDVAPVYDVCPAIVFLIDLDPNAYEHEIRKLLSFLLFIQKPNGGWGYQSSQSGDTSMTQFAVLSLWVADQAGFETPDEAWIKVLHWLLRTQDPSGAWSYQGRDAGSFTLVAQDSINIRPSMAVAGLGSLYLSAEHLGVVNFGRDAQPQGLDAILRKKKSAEQDAKRQASVDRSIVDRARQLGDKWMNENYTVEPATWQFYFLYAFERYHTALELVAGKAEKEPQWYTDGARSLIARQRADGSWMGGPSQHPTADTCFAILFLIRSFRKTIAAPKFLGSGVLVGGRGLPDKGDLIVAAGMVKAKPLVGPAEELITLMENPANEKFDQAVEGLNKLVLEGEEEQLTKVQEQLRELMKDGNPAAREAAVRALSRARRMAAVPLLIEALRDSDTGVVQAGDEGLRFVSRKLSGVTDTTLLTESVREKAIERWKAWYQSIVPDAQFDE